MEKIYFLLLLVIVGANGPASLKSAKAADPACNGNACDVIAISAQQGGGFTFINNSDKNVKVTIRFAFGLGCQGPSDIHFAPRQTKNYRNGGYCSPYSSNYE